MRQRFQILLIGSLIGVFALVGAFVTMTAPSAKAAAVMTQRIADVGPDCLVPDPENPGQDMITCSKFVTKNLRIDRVEGEDVYIRYALEGVTCRGVYVVRFWPNERPNRPAEQWVLGMLDVGGKKSGVLGPYKVPVGQQTGRFNLDFDVFKDEGSVKNPFAMKPEDMETTFVGQCDSGGPWPAVKPPPTPTTSTRPTTSTPATTTTPDDPQNVMCHVGVDEAGTIIVRQEIPVSESAAHANHSRDYPGPCKSES